MNGVKRIVVGMDESSGAAAALRWAVEQGARSGLPVAALMAWSYRDQHRLVRAAPFDLEYTPDDAARDLDAIVERAMGADATAVSRDTRRGDPSDVLLSASRRAELLVVGARGMGGFKGLLVGSVSRDVMNRSHCPVAVIRDASYDQNGPVVVGVDGSEATRAALGWGVADAAARRCPLVALYACRPVVAGDYVVEIASDERLAAQLLQREIGAVDTSGLENPVETRVVRGAAAPALVEASAAASLVVVGTRGKRPLAGLFLGSVSDYVTHHARCPVVVVPPSWTTIGRSEPATSMVRPA